MKSLRDEVAEKGFTIFSINKSKIHNYYPEPSAYPGVSLNDLRENDMITIKVFYISESDPRRILKDIYIELLVDEIGADSVQANILTPLPKFPLSRGDILEIREDEIIYSVRLRDVSRESQGDTSVH